ncbi:iron chaperone [Radiobacillus deserti]|uniref:Iron chaperone n=1 Tax=Radiobacillus deserti TaxID=2594883 RepID=A0A516KI74_9BACI|nr:iron chaperone [Radiobacillus deserti]QDP41089.1 iron chaperone [Radiobacillus deserti]
MESFSEFVSKINNPEHQSRTNEVLDWVMEQFPNLTPVIKWNQPVFTDHGTYIIGFSVSKQHLAASPEREGIIQFSDAIVQAGYEHSKMLIRFPWDKPVDFSLLEKIIEFNILDKAECSTFWRK